MKHQAKPIEPSFCISVRMNPEAGKTARRTVKRHIVGHNQKSPKVSKWWFLKSNSGEARLLDYQQPLDIRGDSITPVITV